VNDLVQKSFIGAIGSVIAVTTQETSQMLSLVAAGCTIIYMLLSIVKLVRDLRKKKNVK
jgi:heme A synthase